jgi:hypothetical protein
LEGNAFSILENKKQNPTSVLNVTKHPFGIAVACTSDVTGEYVIACLSFILDPNPVYRHLFGDNVTVYKTVSLSVVTSLLFMDVNAASSEIFVKLFVTNICPSTTTFLLDFVPSNFLLDKLLLLLSSMFQGYQKSKKVMKGKEKYSDD